MLANRTRSCIAESDTRHRRILIAQQDDRRRRLLHPGPHAGWRTRAALARDQSYLGALRFVVGYGYQTWRALIGLLVILVADAGAGLGLGAGHTRSSPTQYVATHPGHRQPGYGVLGGLRRAERLGAPPPSVPPSRPTLETGPHGIGSDPRDQIYPDQVPGVEQMLAYQDGRLPALGTRTQPHERGVTSWRIPTNRP